MNNKGNIIIKCIECPRTKNLEMYNGTYYCPKHLFKHLPKKIKDARKKNQNKEPELLQVLK